MYSYIHEHCNIKTFHEQNVFKVWHFIHGRPIMLFFPFQCSCQVLGFMCALPDICTSLQTLDFYTALLPTHRLCNVYEYVLSSVYISIRRENVNSFINAQKKTKTKNAAHSLLTDLQFAILSLRVSFDFKLESVF